ncbi:DNA-binding transcriptional regulator GbsR (MarR family) [Bacillus mesophilus]|uniref:HTH-type transcriptional regulator n=1 Tax=Bacillus mesophilus TaxID=1808955 RepID=A0A6M0QAA4_9BACI|nr:GbsR/MarR family transcriptional regulator [Bacillus mesophilus]MBM7662753.1 DNA-binding transcriptional regulator GbsR (MarR family) [Bacillus mesophilus]NEY73187.1 GbsR/MarR family transcriptional regulator [Bacillus mesophilus]
MNEIEIIERSRTRVIDAIAQNMNLYGVTPSIGRLYGLLFFSDKPLTLDEMKEELGMSKTSMSTSVRSLLDINMVEKVWVKGVRKDLYSVEEDWYQSFFDFFTIKWRTGISMNITAIEKSISELEKLLTNHELSDEIREIARLDIEKLDKSLEYYEWLNLLVDSFETKEILNFIPIPERVKKKR